MILKQNTEHCLRHKYMYNVCIIGIVLTNMQLKEILPGSQNGHFIS